MSEQSIIRQRPNISLEAILAIVAVLVVVVGMSYFSSRSQQEIRRAPSGFDGLVQWLVGRSVPARSFAGGWTIDPDTVGLLVVPLFDTDLLDERTPPKTKEQLLLQSDEYDLDLSQFLRKRQNLNTLIILPKWRSGLRFAKLAHPILLNDQPAVERTLNLVSSGNANRLDVIPTPFSDFRYFARDGTALTARTYVSRVFSSDKCTPIIGTRNAMVLGKCAFKAQNPFFILSDPDLFNNHGLRLGDNARIAEDFFAREAGDGLVLVDSSTEYWFAKAQEFERPERTWSDLTQFFAYPFSLLWIGAGSLLILAIWRAGRRFGAIQHEKSGPGAAKNLAINASARLLRLTRKNHAMLDRYVEARLTVLMTRLFGPALAGNKSACLARLAKRSPEPTTRLIALLNKLATPTAHTTSQNAIAFVDEFETLIGEIENDT